MERYVFFIFGAVALGAAISVVAQRRAVYSALSLILCIAALSVLFYLLGASFLAIIQIIVYAGAIMVLFLFVIMLLDPASEVLTEGKVRALSYLALPLALFFSILVLRAAARLGTAQAPVAAAEDNTAAVGRLLFNELLLPFEVTSVLILVAIVGAVVLAGRKT